MSACSPGEIEIIWKAPLAAIMRSGWRQAPVLWCVIKHGSWQGRGLVAVAALETGCSFSAAKLCVWLIMEQLINNIAEIRKSLGETQGAEQDWGTGSAWAAVLEDRGSWHRRCHVRWWQLARVAGTGVAARGAGTGRQACCSSPRHGFPGNCPRYVGGPC